jgi:membrane dipeptidase
MWYRRDFLKAAALAPAMAMTRRGHAASSGETASWAPYRNTLAIDGAGGLGLFWIDRKDDPRIAQDLKHIRGSGLGGVVVTVAPGGRFWLDDAAFRKAQDTLAKWSARIAEHPDTLTLIRTANDLDRAHRGGRTGVIFTFQGTEPLGEDADRVTLFREQGVRIIQLTHNRRNLVGDGCMEAGNAGLSNYGLQIVERLNSEKVVVDLAHGSQRTTAEGIRASKAPVIISHTGCRALSDLPRNTGDAELRALAERGGVAGIIFWPYLRTDTQPMAIDVVRHIEHAIKVCGEDHVGIGTDGGVAPIERTQEYERQNREWIAASIKDGIFAEGRPLDLYTFIPDLNMANRFDVLGGLLSARGHSDDRIAKILGGNFARVMREVWG